MVLVIFTVWCLLTKSEDDTVYTDGDTYIIMEMSEEEKQTNAQSYEEDYPISYWEGTSGEELCSLAEAMLDEIEITEFTVSFEGDSYQVYKTTNYVCSVYIEADKETDEVHYLKTDILDWDGAELNAEIFLDVIELLGEEYIYDDDLTYEDLYEEVESCTGAENEDYEEGYDLIIIADSYVMEIFENEYGYPSCEIMAVEP